ncbi:MAG TPA: hypothetical protein VGC92_08915 [Phenylobacterium sp.]|jgi:hypothetical protein
MGRPYDPARAMRERLKTLEARERARTEARAVAEGVAETVDLARGRGAEFEKPAARRGERETAYRRQAGLEWLERKGRITAAQRQAGEAYGAAFRRAGEEARIGSTLEVQPGGGAAAGPSLALVLRRAESRMRAEAALAAMRERLFGQGDLVSVCDQVCGRELTPREAGGGEREGLRVEAVLKVALDLLGLRR